MANIIIIGAGAAGLFAAGSALACGHTVTVLEHMDAAGKKLLITGKGRCNVTNNTDAATILQNVRTNPRFLFSAASVCDPAFIMQTFEALGVPLKTERGRRVFPQSDKAQDVLAALLQYASGAKILYNTGVKSLVLQNGVVCGVKTHTGLTLGADAVLVATGGLSYQSTGSTGDGYRLARQAGHSIIEPQPSLVSLVEQGSTAKKMMGLSLRNISLTLTEDGKPIYTEQGEMLFTHFGISGPLVLSASAHIRDMKTHRYAASIDLKPALSEEKLYARITQDFSLLANKDAANCLVKLLPAKMQPVMLEMWGVEPLRKVNQITREERLHLVQLLKAFPIALQEKGDLAHAVITSGGVNVKEVNPKTMQSKLCEGLYFAGEVLDVDAYTGGYNLTLAFATAHAAATHIE